MKPRATELGKIPLNPPNYIEYISSLYFYTNTPLIMKDELPRKKIKLQYSSEENSKVSKNNYEYLYYFQQ